MSLSPPQQRMIAGRYGRALFDVAYQQDVVSDVADALAALVKVHADTPHLAELGRSPIISRAEKEAAMRTIGETLHLAQPLRGCLRELARHDRLTLLAQVESSYRDFWRQQRGDVAVTITTARALKAAQKKDIVAALEHALGANIEASTATNSRLIGGVKIRVGSRELDASVQGKLAQAAERLYEGINHISRA